MKKLMFNCLLAIAAMAFSLTAGAQEASLPGAPHTVTAKTVFKNVALNWKAPQTAMTLQWHNDYNYNGMDGIQLDPQGPCVLYGGAKFSADDLKPYVGMTIDKIATFEYREVDAVDVLIYENGVVVRQQSVDISNFVKNSYRTTVLNEPYVIPAGKEIMIIEKVTHGTNQELTVTTDQVCHTGKGNIYSYDGKNWKIDGNGDFIITAYISKPEYAAPDGYNVYCDNQKLNSELITATSYTAENQAVGNHKYVVAAVYGSEEKAAAEVSATSKDITDFVASAVNVKATTEGLTNTITWMAPLKAGQSEMTWAGTTMSTGIGGTSTTAPKVWVKHEFTANDLVAYPDYKINALNAYFYDNTISTMKIVIWKNGVIDYSQDVTLADEDKTANAWHKFALTTPYQMVSGNAYAYGFYTTHAKSGHPIGVDNTEAVGSKANQFSVSSPSSVFNNSKPSWKTLASGNIAGNFLMSADVVPTTTTVAEVEIKGYDVYRNGTKVASEVAAQTYSDDVTDLGYYTYDVVAVSTDNKTALPASASTTVKLPAEYSAPVVLDYDLDEDNNLSIEWSSEAHELQHYGTPSYMAGFDEDIAILYGAKFSAAELAPYVGYKFSSLKFAVGEDIAPFKIELYTGSGQKLYSYQVNAVQPLAIYTMNLESTVTIPEGQDLYLVYNATLPGGSSPILLDGGPLQEGGAMVSLTNGANWMKLGTVYSTYNNYNIVIGGMIVPNGTAAGAKAIELGKPVFSENAKKITLNASELKVGYGIDAATTTATETAAPAMRKAAGKPQVASFRVYKNGAVAEETTSTTYSEEIKKNGVFNYYITSVFSNGWESPASKVIQIVNSVEQKAAAPYDLQGTAQDLDFTLTWKDANEAPCLKYYDEDTKGQMTVGMTGSGTREGHHGIRYDAEDLAPYVGMTVSRINFMLTTNDIKTASVFVIKNNSKIYEQEIAIADLAPAGTMNEILLDNPVVIEAGKNMIVGYHITYANGIKPIALDGVAAVKPGYSDLISSSATDGYWYSLATKYNVNYNVIVSAVLAKADEAGPQKAMKKAGAATTYSIYCNDVLVADGITEKSYTVVNAEEGLYTVTATVNGEETAVSNGVYFTPTTPTAITNINAESANGAAFNILGQRVSDKAKGIIILNGRKQIIK